MVGVFDCPFSFFCALAPPALTLTAAPLLALPTALTPACDDDGDEAALFLFRSRQICTLRNKERLAACV
jgi:hypothetical protein